MIWIIFFAEDKAWTDLPCSSRLPSRSQASRWSGRGCFRRGILAALALKQRTQLSQTVGQQNTSPCARPDYDLSITSPSPIIITAPPNNGAQPREERPSLDRSKMKTSAVRSSGTHGLILYLLTVI